MRHRWALEEGFDGGVVEVSTDGGSTWQDVANAPYTSELLYSEDSPNPLAGRRALTGPSPGYPAYVTHTIDAGPAVAGKTALIRYRVGTDWYLGDEGWDIDRIEFTGLANTPFEEVVFAPDPGC